ncbi:MBL fold metallo-hydrolase [Desulfospira joergensenii]|uniref:MBL fold metallo-hydrolase n=1 Tax=Desulfospira joergensenii TaxID=53329 RepID=UPI000484E8F2|nr:MBL fold metallo-hydrolase [Desulfospira joergensenii]
MRSNQRSRVNILGSGTCVPSLERYPCSILVRRDEMQILVDAGPGTMGQLLKLGVHIDDIDMILLSHFHLDHCAEVAPIIFATKYPRFDREKPLTLAGGSGIRDLFEGLNQVFGRSLDMEDSDFRIIEFPEKGRLDFKEMGIGYTRVIHKPESRAYRFTDPSGFCIVYSGDTDFSEDLIEFSEDADVLICESALPDALKIDKHLTPSLAGEIASRAGVKKLVLTHFYPECDDADMEGECRNTYGGDLVLARDLMEV